MFSLDETGVKFLEHWVCSLMCLPGSSGASPLGFNNGEAWKAVWTNGGEVRGSVFSRPGDSEQEGMFGRVSPLSGHSGPAISNLSHLVAHTD